MLGATKTGKASNVEAPPTSSSLPKQGLFGVLPMKAACEEPNCFSF